MSLVESYYSTLSFIDHTLKDYIVVMVPNLIYNGIEMKKIKMIFLRFNIS